MADRPVVSPPLDRYVVLDYLAEGGMGAIYKGKKLGAGGFEKEVVLKQLLPEFTSQPEFIDLFLREARLTATLQHANIVHTIDLVNAGDEYFIVMEYVRGGDLRTLLKRAKRRKRRVPPQAAIFIAREVLAALGYAHDKLSDNGQPLGIIHRDVSPSNILVSGSGEVKLTDFGIAKASTHRSIFYRVKGKVGYMSPEQAKNETLDARSDLYSIAVCLYEMLTGERLFVAPSLTTSADDLYKQPVPAVSKKRADLPKELDKVMWKALAVAREERYQTAGQFAEALARVAHRSSLNCAASELARHMTEACGVVSEWHSTQVSEAARPGTEAYVFAAGEGTENLRLADVAGFDDAGGRGTGTAILASEDDDSDLDSMDDSDLQDDVAAADGEWARAAQVGSKAAPAASLPGDPTGTATRAASPVAGKRRAGSEKGDAQRLAGIELTSIIQMAELTHAGARPLVDFTGPLAQPRPPDSAEVAGPPMATTRPAPAASRPPPVAAKPPARGPAPAPPVAPPAAASPAKPAKPAGKPGAPPASSARTTQPAKAAAGAPAGKAVAAGKAAPAGKGVARSPSISTEKVKPVPDGDPWARRIPAWVPILLMLLAGVGIAYAIAVSGPDLKAAPAGSGKGLAPPPPPPPPAESRQLTITSEPAGARVTIDGQDRGCVTPCTTSGLPAATALLVRLDLDGHQPWTGLVAPGAAPTRAAVLRKAPKDPARLGSVVLRTSVPAEVMVDGRELGHVTTAGPLALMPGTSKLTVVAGSGAKAEVSVTVKAGQSQEIAVDLR